MFAYFYFIKMYTNKIKEYILVLKCVCWCSVLILSLWFNVWFRDSILVLSLQKCRSLRFILKRLTQYCSLYACNCHRTYFKSIKSLWSLWKLWAMQLVPQGAKRMGGTRHLEHAEDVLLVLYIFFDNSRCPVWGLYKSFLYYQIYTFLA